MSDCYGDFMWGAAYGERECRTCCVYDKCFFKTKEKEKLMNGNYLDVEQLDEVTHTNVPQPYDPAAVSTLIWFMHCKRIPAEVLMPTPEYPFNGHNN